MHHRTPSYIQELLNRKVEQYNRLEFIQNDPICIPHKFSKNTDREIAGFFASILAWGLRKTIINKCEELFSYMDNAPYDFICHHEEQDLKVLMNFKHRTFAATDLLYFIAFFKDHYSKYNSLEDAFIPVRRIDGEPYMQNCLTVFKERFFALDNVPQRTKKHISSPAQQSACKRLNMFLRWMVRSDQAGVDFGIWKRIKPSELTCPLDVHVDRTARGLGLIQRRQSDWKAALELTDALSSFDSKDPVKYDFALFGLSIEEKMFSK